MRVLITNDDGIAAPGIAALVRAVAGAGYDAVAAAPLGDFSGSGAAIGPVHTGQGVRTERVHVDGAGHVACYGVDGPPALAVMAACLGGFGAPPDVVVSGINPGPNTGRSVLHSGTVGAALTAANFGITGVAVSQAVAEDEWFVDTAAEYALRALDWAASAPAKTVLNVNVPNVAADAVAGVRAARLAPFGTVRAAIADSADGMLEIELRATDERLAEDTDTMLVNAGFVAVTLLAGIRAADGSDRVAEALDLATSR